MHKLSYGYPRKQAFTGANLGSAQAKFNFNHSSQRIIIEHAFGQLKGRFRLLSKQIDVHCVQELYADQYFCNVICPL